MKKIVALALLGTVLAGGCNNKPPAPPPSSATAPKPVIAPSAPPDKQNALKNLGASGS